MIAQWNAPISDRFSSLCARVFSPAAAILESEKTLGTRLRPDYPGHARSSEEWDVNDEGSEAQRSGKAKKI